MLPLQTASGGGLMAKDRCRKCDTGCTTCTRPLTASVEAVKAIQDLLQDQGFKDTPTGVEWPSAAVTRARGFLRRQKPRINRWKRSKGLPTS